ncbi:MAG TPA: protein kinase [Polyangiaceae bacterium]|nr:protein kinase [Polyangiaceae bacterium]
MSETVGLSTGLPVHIQPGLIIAGKYRLEQEIGRGSMGTVFRAVHVTLGQRVAIKLISGEHSQSAEARQRFSVEAKAAAKLRSRHVVQVIDNGETEQGNPYIVLELLEGETLEERLVRDHDLPLGDAVRVVTHVGRALARAHAQGVVHRDLKPANVFLVKSDDDDAGWVAKVLDFGIAKVAQESGTTVAGTVLGTPLFMSPEQVRGASSVDHRADLYSLGMCLFHMLTGDYAFYSESYSDTLVGICTLPLPLLREKAPWVPEAVESWFQRACAKLPLERFQSADEMTEALQAAAGPATPLSKHKSVPEGRIAPETLVGFAAPPIPTLQAQPTEALGLAQTQTEAQLRLAPISIDVARGAAAVSGTELRPPRPSYRPLAIGLGLGALALASVGTTLLLLGGRAPEPALRSEAPAVPSASAPGLVPLPPLAPSPATMPAQPAPRDLAPSALGSVSSVAAESKPMPRSQPSAVPKKTSPSSPRVAPSPLGSPKPARAAEAPKPSGSDLGF